MDEDAKRQQNIEKLRRILTGLDLLLEEEPEERLREAQNPPL